MSDDDPTPETPPLLRVVRGDPTPEQLAALVAVVAATAAASQDDVPQRRPEWSARHRLLRPAHRHGPGAWRASAR